MRYALPSLLFAATVSFALGVTLPLIRVEQFFLFPKEPSLIGVIHTLWRTGDYVLALTILLFSVAFPATKLLLLHMAAYAGTGARLPVWLRALSNWSMLDVVLVALVIFAAETSGVAAAAAQPGLWFFAASAVLTVGASALAKIGG